MLADISVLIVFDYLGQDLLFEANKDILNIMSLYRDVSHNYMKQDNNMNKFLLTSLLCIATVFALSAQQNSFLLMPKVGLGFADGTTCVPLGLDLGYEFSTNRISLDILVGAKKRTDYANGDYKDVLIANMTLSYSKIFKTKKILVIPDLGVGIVSGSWKRNSDGNGEHFQTGFGLTFGCGAEYPVKEYLSLGLTYTQALLLNDFSGNGAILSGVVFKINRRTK